MHHLRHDATHQNLHLNICAGLSLAVLQLLTISSEQQPNLP